MILNPLPSISIEEAMQKQFAFVDAVTEVFSGDELLTRGDLGVAGEWNMPQTTKKVQQVLARFFHAEDAVLVRGAGTAAIRYALNAVLAPGDAILIHDAPIYQTTINSMEVMGLQLVVADFNQKDAILHALKEHPEIKAALIQYTRQRIDDRYDIKEVINTIKSYVDIPIITDDNYAVMKVSQIGCEAGADLSCFSTFKLLGPEGIGCIVGKQKYLKKIQKLHYSGGMQTQGFEALEVLRGLVYAPVALAIQATVCEETARRLNQQELPGVKQAMIANAQSKVILVEFEQEIAAEVLRHAVQLGAAPHPVGAESKYEFIPLFYRVSGTFLKQDPSLAKRMIRINPMRCGSDTIIKILQAAMERVEACS